MPYIKYINPITEIHYSDQYPKEFEVFRKKYLKVINKGHGHNLYVNFTNYASDPLQRNANIAPNHNDPVGVYGYPLEYVVKYPSDIWYGQQAKYLRVLKMSAKKPLIITDLDEWEAKDILRKMGFDDIHTLWSNAKKIFKGHISGPKSSLAAKTFMEIIQMRVEEIDMETYDDDFDFKKYDRSPLNQTQLFKKAGIDAIMDISPNQKRAVISDREPEQVIFLNRYAFTVEEIFHLRPGVLKKDEYLNVGKPNVNVIERKLASRIATVIDDQIFEGPEKYGLWGWSYYWTKKGRRIEVDFPLPDNAHQNLKLGEKPHKRFKVTNNLNIHVKIRSEIGDIGLKYPANAKFDDVVSDVAIDWEKLEKSPKETDWKSETLKDYKQQQQQKVEKFRDEQVKKELQASIQKLPVLWEYLDYFSELYSIPYAKPEGSETSLGYFYDGVYGLFSVLIKTPVDEFDKMFNFMWENMTSDEIVKSDMNSLKKLLYKILQEGRDNREATISSNMLYFMSALKKSTANQK